MQKHLQIDVSPLCGHKRMEVHKMRAKRNYKDTVFRMLFSEKESLLSLYNAVGRRIVERMIMR